MPGSTTTSQSSLRVAVLADSDTRWKWGALTAHRIVTDSRLSGFLLRGRATPTPRQLQEVGVTADSLAEVTAVEFLKEMERDAEEYDVVVLALVGGAVQAMLHGLARAWKGRAERPVVVTGYVGVVYEKLADGLLLRHGADLVLANSRQDAERFRAVYRGVGADASGVTETALPFLGGAEYTESDPYTVVFAAQPSVPDNRRDRMYLLERMVQHARLHPEREVLLKLRSRPGEHTTHIEELPYQRLAQRIEGGLPSNFRLVYGNMGEVLDRTDLLVTVSSTAALESLHRRIPTVVLTDNGVREALGNHHFIGSGCLASWDELDAGHQPAPDPVWVSRQGVAAEGGYERAFDEARDRVRELLTADSLPPISPYYTLATAPGYLPGILARHHLDRDGSPLPGAPGADKDPGPVRQIVRRAARGAYRHGVQRVAPVIRRMGEL
ncbi:MULTISPECIES: DUF6716 putative glycosyltransferase [Streptomyces]|uniref:Uncharacterized protein n=1 Tax=Streptomyces albus (strain ATCC 21838 / DSM 41398 / FERM P-419 / JCM 4703 / NBRC 107858) TaxID=1081613 RepID=A0A0B5F0R7_STRA4|nr:DUF6716 putative glycosyltransferase [Streptomyces sp. SCSIO ZS0520]AJE85180.1 hypothetical protein SLNWT_4804 [Streptomyces albus]AOU79487.1 hypothetical protein SLNHY_4796 [Streptomyces albus]AYN35211.1 hypothetical protein DUI70_4713 [Streptomyces albus]